MLGHYSLNNTYCIHSLRRRRVSGRQWKRLFLALALAMVVPVMLPAQTKFNKNGRRKQIKWHNLDFVEREKEKWSPKLPFLKKPMRFCCNVKRWENLNWWICWSLNYIWWLSECREKRRGTNWWTLQLLEFNNSKLKQWLD